MKQGMSKMLRNQFEKARNTCVIRWALTAHAFLHLGTFSDLKVFKKNTFWYRKVKNYHERWYGGKSTHLSFRRPGFDSRSWPAILGRYSVVFFPPRWIPGWLMSMQISHEVCLPYLFLTLRPALHLSLPLRFTVAHSCSRSTATANH